jgi:DNA-binding MarR family transcriptional regulator
MKKHDTTHALASALRVALGQLKRKLRQQTSLGDFTLSQLQVLGRLDRDGPTTVTALAQAEGVRPQSMGATVAALEAMGLLAGAADPGDGRRTILSLTPACKEKVKAGRAIHDDWLFYAIQARLTPEEQADLARAVGLLTRLAEA